MALEDIRNFVAVNPELATAGQPTEAELELVAQAGFETVVNLGLLDPRYCLADEAASVARLGLEYVHLPVDFKAPEQTTYFKFEALLAARAGKRVFVHCAANYRVACFVAVFGERRLGWSREQAEAHLRKVWEPDATWRAWLDAVRVAGAAG